MFFAIYIYICFYSDEKVKFVRKFPVVNLFLNFKYKSYTLFGNFVKIFLGKRLRDEREQKYAIFSNSSRYSGFFTFRPEKDFCIFTPVRRFVFKPVLKF